MLKSLVPAVLLSTLVHIAGPASVAPPIFLGVVGLETTAVFMWTLRKLHPYEINTSH